MFQAFQVANSSGEEAEAASVVPAVAGVVVFFARFGVVVLVVLLVVLATLWIHGCQTLVCKSCVLVRHLASVCLCIHANSMP